MDRADQVRASEQSGLDWSDQSKENNIIAE